MKDLRRKLRRQLGQERGVPSPDEDTSSAAREAEPTIPEHAGPGLRSFLLNRRELARQARQKVELPGDGREAKNEAGSFYLRHQRYPRDHVHGYIGLDLVDRLDWQKMSVIGKDEAFADAKLDHCLFLDTETTGLAGGAGTTVFMTGIGWYEEDAFVLEQVFMRTFADEAGALLHIAQRLAERPMMVTFVGKSFDRHRLAARMSIYKIDSPVLAPLHLDLYYCARRTWGDELPNVKLRTVEEERLGFYRDDDLPGSEAPAAFLSWIRNQTGAIDRVFEHNRLDVISLAALLARLGAS